MSRKRLPDKIKKNILDLQYNKYLQYYNTSVMVLFTYIIGIIIALITHQVNYNSSVQMILVSFISVAIISVIVLVMSKFRYQMANIFIQIKKLRT
jgi:sulfite exporter TauE/SafE